MSEGSSNNENNEKEEIKVDQESAGAIILDSTGIDSDEDEDDYDENHHHIHEGSVPIAKEAKETAFTRVKGKIMKYPDLVGFMFTAASTIMFSLSSMTVKYISTKFSSYEIVFFRCIVQFILGSLIIMINADRKDKFYLMGHFHKKTTLVLFGRGFFGSIAMILTFSSLHYLPLSDSILIGFLGPVFTAIWGFIILHEKSTVMETIGFCFSFMGITLVARPSFLMKLFGLDEEAGIVQSGSFSASFEEAGTTARDRMLGTLAGLGYAVFSGLSCVLARKVGKGVHTMVVVNWLSFFGIIVPIPIMIFADFVMPKGLDWLYLIGIGFITTVAQCNLKKIYLFIVLFIFIHFIVYICLFILVLLTTGLRTGTAGRVMIANYLQILWSIILEIIFFGTYPHWLSLIGACLILVNAGIAIYKAATAAKPEAQGAGESGSGPSARAKKKGKYSMLDSTDGNDEHVNIDDDDKGEEEEEEGDHNEDDHLSGSNEIRMETLNKK